MTPQELARLKVLYDATSPGPWRANGPFCVGSQMKLVAQFDAADNMKANRNFIIASHAALPELVAEIERLRAENERLQSEIVPLLETIVCGGHYERADNSHAGWYDTMALSHIRDAGDRLVELGKWECHPDGAGRRQWYRRIERRVGGKKKAKRKAYFVCEDCGAQILSGGRCACVNPPRKARR